MSDKKRPAGKAITGACNLAFLFLAVSGRICGGRASGRKTRDGRGALQWRIAWPGARLEQYRDGNLGRRVRSWTRFLHTSEALGPVGRFAAGLASLGSVVLVYTGFALALRPWLRWREKKSSAGHESVR